MYQLNLNSSNGLSNLRSLIKKWSDNSRVTVSLIVVKIGEAFSMYHQTSSVNLKFDNQKLAKLHPVLVNDLDTDQNILLTLNTNGVIVHFYLINNYGQLKIDDNLRKAADKTANQEYLDYFYCIAKNIESYVKAKHA